MNNLERSVGILGTGRHLPERVVTNLEMEKIVNTTNEWIESRTGIRLRRYADENTATSDMAKYAGQKALEKAGIKAKELDLIIVATVTGDHSFPSTACLVQEQLGAVNASAFDLGAACSGFIYGLSVAHKFIASGAYKYVLVIGAETMSRILDFQDRKTCVLFGDGAGAIVVGPVEQEKGLKAFELGADGKGGHTLSLPAGGSRLPASFKTVTERLHYVHMAGNDVFKFAVRVMGDAANRVIEKAGWQLEDVNFLVPHQANIRIIKAAAKRLKIPMEKVHVNLDVYGNMSAASIPVALDESVREGKVKQKDKIVLVGFGGGLTWGACALTW